MSECLELPCEVRGLFGYSSMDAPVDQSLPVGCPQLPCAPSPLFDYISGAKIALVPGCTDTGADNYNPLATVDNGSCTYTGCCMYSATSLAAGDLVAADLPDAITLLGVGSLSRSGTGYGNTTNGVIFETDTWARYIGGVRTTQNCLITGDGNFTAGDDAVEDQFAASYSINYDGIDYTANRISLCVWLYSGPEDCAGLDPSETVVNYLELRYSGGKKGWAFAEGIWETDGRLITRTVPADPEEPEFCPGYVFSNHKSLSESSPTGNYEPITGGLGAVTVS